MPVSPHLHALRHADAPQTEGQKPSRSEVEAAVRTIIRWAGEDPGRDGLIETPARVSALVRGVLLRLQSKPGRNSGKDF